jgi:hypothetical protein
MRSKGRKKSSAPRAPYTTSVSRLVPRNVGERKISSGTIGDRERRSTSTNAAIATAPPARSTSTRASPMPAPLPAWTSAYTTSASESVTSAAPGRSTGPVAVESRDSSTCTSARATTTAATGALMTNSQRQDACATTHPPATGPPAARIALAADHVPIAAPRSVASG